jgi:hypothetical protein
MWFELILAAALMVLYVAFWPGIPKEEASSLKRRSINT